MEEREQEQQKTFDLPLLTKAGIITLPGLPLAGIELLVHGGPTPVALTGFVLALLAAKSPWLVERLGENERFLLALSTRDDLRAKLDALTSGYFSQQVAKLRQEQPKFFNEMDTREEHRQVALDLEDELELLQQGLMQTRASMPTSEPQERRAGQNFEALLAALPGTCTFSQIIVDHWYPTLDRIFLGFLPGGTPIFCSVESLCHVALAGATDGGKSSIMRLLMAQLCHIGCKVLLLNPHYTCYDRKSGEDWTPYEQYLMRDPMECKSYQVIEECLKYAATALLSKRIEKHSRGKHVGAPYFIVLDELPAIIDEIPDAPKYLAKLLRQGRKFGIFLISASQDFLIKTIDPKGSGGGVRECYRTAFYVGGDTVTGKTLLDIQSAKDLPEEVLGKGVVMLRAGQGVKRASLVRIPFLDNDGLYYLLGPSTYIPEEDKGKEDDEEAGFLQMVESMTELMDENLLEALEAHNNGYRGPRALERELGITYYRAQALYQELKKRGLIEV